MLKQKDEDAKNLSSQIQSHIEAIKDLNEEINKKTEEIDCLISQQNRIEQEHKALLVNKD